MAEVDIYRLLNRIGALVERKAKRLAPIDLGLLRASIKHRVEGMSVIIYTEVEYAEDMEFGKPPEPLSDTEKEDLKGWANRHKIPYKAVIKSIETKGIKAGTTEAPLKTLGGTFRPFLRPALHQSMPEIKSMVMEEFK
jgi:hypothetical protein